MDKTDAVMDLAKRRGFLWPSYEVYGGAAGFYDYGPLGAAMKERFEALWRHTFRTSAIPAAEVVCPRVTVEEVLKASGHVDEFTDLVVKCKQGHPHRADHLVEAAGYEGTADALTETEIDQEIVARKPKCPICGDATWTNAAPLNLMFQTEIGPGSGRVGYMRPETAQGIFTDFPHLLRYFRGKLPFAGIQVGGSNRNEISPRQGMLRLREFSMMEAEVFFADTNEPLPAFSDVADQEITLVPNSDEKPVAMTLADAVANGVVANESLGYYMGLTYNFLATAGMDPTKLRFRQHLDTEMAHYANDCWDAEFHSERYGWVECVGIADRGCYDLEQHAKHSGKEGDFQVTIDLPEPVEFEAALPVPVMGILGRTFKARAKQVAAQMEAQYAAALNDAAAGAGVETDDELAVTEPKNLEAATEPMVLEINGESVEIPPEGYQLRRGTFKISGTKLIPRVIEPSFGVDRILYALWEHAYDKGEKNGEAYVRLQLSPKVAPIQAAVLPLTSAPELTDIAANLCLQLTGAGIRVDTDGSGNIGRRYARQDEVGTPYCITVDNDTPSDGAVTVRDRDTTEQERIAMGELVAYIMKRV